MFCSNCGSQIPDNVKFCNNCGTQINASKTGSSVNSGGKNKGTNQRSQNKSNKVVAACIAFIASFCVIVFVGIISDPDPTNTFTATTTKSQTTSAPNPAYELVFSDTGIIHHWESFMNETSNFVRKNEEGVIMFFNYGHEGDVVKESYEIHYFPVSDYDDYQKSSFEKILKTEYASYEALNCCEVTYDTGARYFSVSIHLKDIDKPENYTELYNAGLIDSLDLISMKRTEQGLIADGAIKK